VLICLPFHLASFTSQQQQDNTFEESITSLKLGSLSDDSDLEGYNLDSDDEFQYLEMPKAKNTPPSPQLDQQLAQSPMPRAALAATLRLSALQTKLEMQGSRPLSSHSSSRSTPASLPPSPSQLYVPMYTLDSSNFQRQFACSISASPSPHNPSRHSSAPLSPKPMYRIPVLHSDQLAAPKQSTPSNISASSLPNNVLVAAATLSQSEARQDVPTSHAQAPATPLGLKQQTQTLANNQAPRSAIGDSALPISPYYSRTPLLPLTRRGGPRYVYVDPNPGEDEQSDEQISNRYPDTVLPFNTINGDSADEDNSTGKKKKSPFKCCNTQKRCPILCTIL